MTTKEFLEYLHHRIDQYPGRLLFKPEEGRLVLNWAAAHLEQLEKETTHERQ